MSEEFSYEIKVSGRIKNMRLSVHPDGKIIVSKPPLVPQILVTRFVKKHEAWILKKLDHIKKHPAPLLGKLTVRDYKAHKELARALVTERTQFYASKYGFSFGTIRIGNQKGRWGSCSKRGNLNFNYKIVFLPKELQDYIIIHEVCHLKEHNHSARFWSLVTKECPDWKTHRKSLKRY